MWGGSTLSKFNINALQEYKEVYVLKRNWASKNGYKHCIQKMQQELIELLKYYIRQMINSGTLCEQDAINSIKEELRLPFWREFNIDISAEKLYNSQKNSLARIIKKQIRKLIS